MSERRCADLRAKLSTYRGLPGKVFQAQNPDVNMSLTATWSRADLT